MTDTILHEIDIEEICETVESINITEVKENILLDMSNQLKEKFDKIEYLEKRLKLKHKSLIRKVLTIYGLIKAIDKISNENVELPIELAFSWRTKYDTYMITEYLNHFIDIMFFFDIVMNFRTTYFNRRTGVEIMEKPLIVKNYLKGAFIIDLLSTIPFDIIYDVYYN